MNKKVNKILLKFMLISLSFAIASVYSSADKKKEFAAKLQEGIRSGIIIYRLTEPEEIIGMLGPPMKEEIRQDGGMLLKEFKYPGIFVVFGKMRDYPAPFTILNLKINSKEVDIGKGKKVILRNNGDLAKLDSFNGFQNVSLINCDLRDKAELLESMRFDSLTEWPAPDKLPEGFFPQELLEEGKNPGLGLRSLHKEKIDGRGVGIAIIDQPLLLGHIEYTSRIMRYDATNLVGFSPAMHGPPVVSIAIGKDIGVAPGAALTYFAVPMWEDDNMPYIKAMRKIFELNKILPENEKIRVVSISTGMFPHYPNFDEWKEVLKQAEEQRILVVSCDQSLFEYGILSRIPGEDPDDPEHYLPGKYHSKNDVLRVPGSNRTIASHRGTEVYAFDREGGMSWGAPYIAGLAALAYQVKPEIKPKEILEYLVKSSVKTKAGPVVSPRGFINLVKETNE
ncbi:MAG: hypothetical protein GTN73_06015 [Candidatus Aminicenantes bacterium]|nr:hypothetical protein [Candidatus Aminicenantes bacterium]